MQVLSKETIDSDAEMRMLCDEDVRKDETMVNISGSFMNVSSGSICADTSYPLLSTAIQGGSSWESFCDG